MERDIFIRLLDQLRKRLIIMASAVFITAIASFIFIDQIRELLIRPGKELGMDLIYLQPAEALMADLQLAFVTAVLITLPLILYQLVALIMAVRGLSRKSVFLLTVFMYVLFALGTSFSYFVVFPFALNFFLSFSTADLIPRFSISNYLSFATRFLFSFGLVFQLPLVFWFLGRAGLVGTAFLRRNRKYALLIILIFSAILTPPDVFSQVLMACPLLLLYEIGIILVHISERKRRKASEITA